MLNDLNVSRDAARILALPEARHPRLAALCQRLASKPGITLDDAAPIIAAAAEDLGINSLDVDMAQPGARVSVPFVPATTGSPDADFQDRVSAIVAHLDRQRRR